MPAGPPLPVQALDYAAGFLLATAAVRGLTRRLAEGRGSRWRTSLARVAELLAGLARPSGGPPITGAESGDVGTVPEQTAWGPALRLKAPLTIQGTPIRWDHPAGPLGTDGAWWGQPRRG